MLKTNPKIDAFEKLLKIAEEGSFDLYASTWGIYGEQHVWPVDCLKPLREPGCSKSIVRQQALDEILNNLTLGDFPKNLFQLKKEQDMIRLTLMAGADPNAKDLVGHSVFESFWLENKIYGILELAKDSRFLRPGYLDEMYKGLNKKLAFQLHNEKTYHLDSQEIQDRDYQEIENQKELIYTLFQKNMYPTDVKVFERLSRIILEKDPQFFDKKKAQVQRRLAQAKTPIQIYTALMGKGKEKN